jgi:hypothetical protein
MTLVYVSVILKCNYESCVNVVNKSKIQSEIPSIIAHLNRDNINTMIVNKYSNSPEIGTCAKLSRLFT